MRRLTAYLAGMTAFALIMLAAPLLARAQVTDKPITTWPITWQGVVQHLSINDKRGCVAGWSPAKDVYSFPSLNTAVLDTSLLTTGAQQTAISMGISQQQVSQLSAERTVNVKGQPATMPCVGGPPDHTATPTGGLWQTGSLKGPAMAWVVADSTTGKRTAYCYDKATAKLAKTCGTADTKMQTDFGTVVPMAGNCSRYRVVVKSWEVYCPWMTSAMDLTPGAPVLVTLMRQVK